MNGLNAPKRIARNIGQIGGMLLRPRFLGNSTKTDASLHRSVSWMNRLALAGVWLVLYGLGLELVLAIQTRHGRNFAEVWWPVIATAAIAIGIVLEFMAHRTSQEIENELDRRSEEKVAAANQRAAEADERAAKAMLALAEYQAPRDLSEEQGTDMVEKLSQFAGQPYSISSYSHQECKVLEAQIDDVLRGADWKPVQEAGKETFVGARRGILLQWHKGSGDNTQQAGVALYEAMKGAGLVVTWAWYSFPKAAFVPKGVAASTTISVMVGTKH